MRLVGASALVGFALVAVMAWSRCPPPGAISSWRAIDERRAIATISTRDDPVVALVDRNTGVVWYRTLPGRASTLPESDGISIGGDVVSVRSDQGNFHKGPTELISESWSLEDGRSLWRASPEENPDYNELTVGTRTLVIESIHQRGGDFVRALDRKLGRERWRKPLDVDASIIRAWTASRSLIVEHPSDVQLYSLENGEQRSMLTHGRGCIVGTSYYAIGHIAPPGVRTFMQSLDWYQSLSREEKLEYEKQYFKYLMRVDLSRASPPVPIGVVSLPPVDGEDTSFRSVACGVFEGSLVFTLSRDRGRKYISAGKIELVALEPSSARLSWRLELGAVGLDVFGPDPRPSDPAFPLSGELSRFVPIQLIRPSTVLYVLDLEQRRIARISDSFVKTRYFPLMCHRAQCHIGAEAKDGSMAIIALDGRTGRITAAVRMPGFFFGEVKPTHIAAGALWLHDRDEARLNALHFAVLDTTTLHPLRHHGPDVVDVRDQVDRWLNLRDVGVGAVSPNTNAQNKP